MRVLLRSIVAMAAMIAVLFGTAGRWDLPTFWAYLGLLVVVLIVAMRLTDPDLVKERMHPAPGGLDRSLRFVVMPFFLAQMAVAGLDVGRYHWSGEVSVGVNIAGFVLLAASFALTIWAIHTNRFFSPVVRIQEERGHHLITGGPYRYVRHPGYVAAIGSSFGSVMALGSWWSLVPNVPVFVLILRRTIIEDRFLHENLDGYAEFAKQTRYRWVPGVF